MVRGGDTVWWWSQILHGSDQYPRNSDFNWTFAASLQGTKKFANSSASVERRESAFAWPSHQNSFREDASRTVQSQDHSAIPSRRVFGNHPWRDTMQCWTWRKIAVMQLSLKDWKFFFARLSSIGLLISPLVVHTTIIKRSNDYCFHYNRNILELTTNRPRPGRY